MELTISQISKTTGLSADTLRYYEKEGILSAKRRENGYRYYDEKDITDLKYLVVMKYAGFSLAEIKNIEMISPDSISPGTDPNEDCVTIVKNIINKKVTELKLAIRNYQKIVELLEASLSIMDCPEKISPEEIRERSAALDEYIGQIFEDIRKGEFIRP